MQYYPLDADRFCEGAVWPGSALFAQTYLSQYFLIFKGTSHLSFVWHKNWTIPFHSYDKSFIVYPLIEISWFFLSRNAIYGWNTYQLLIFLYNQCTHACVEIL